MQTMKRLLSRLCLLFTVCSLLVSAIPLSTAADAAVGYATWSVELFTVGCGYLVKPVRMPIYKGETAADGLLRLLSQYGFAAYYGGTPDEAFYLGYIADGTASNTRYNGYRKSATPAAPKKLNLSPSIPSMLDGHLKRTMTFYDPSDYQKHYTGYIGEFVITNGSGWMYSVDHRFPSVGFSDTRLSNGDVVRVQFTLGFGADIGGGFLGIQLVFHGDGALIDALAVGFHNGLAAGGGQGNGEAVAGYGDDAQFHFRNVVIHSRFPPLCN